MPKLKDLTGYSTGKIVVLRRDGLKNRQATWLCKCECGKTFIQYGSPIRKGKVKSCGCLYRDKEERAKIARKSIAKIKHGDSYSRLYFVWLDIRRRCDSESDIGYPNYGGRGIRVCDEWDKSYVAFKQWALCNGYDENAKRGKCTIDRIDVNGDYSPNNCRWISMREQCKNKRNSISITWRGETHSTSEWAEITGIQRSTIYSRYKHGWNTDDIFSTHKYNPHHVIIY